MTRSQQDCIKLIGTTKNSGLASTLSTFCLGCAERLRFETSPKITLCDVKRYDINVRSVWGHMASGGGCAKLNETLTTMGVSGLSRKTFTRLEMDIGKCWEKKVQEETALAAEEERQHAVDSNTMHEGVPAISVVCDGGWSKRSHKHTYNALGGVGVIIGLNSKKILHIGVRNKTCQTCSYAETRGTDPIEHECRKNWNGSSQAMEADIILEGFNESEDKYGLRYTQIIADGDSSTVSTLVDEGPPWCRDVNKLECANHAVKCVRGHLEKLVEDKPRYKGPNRLTKNVRVRLCTILRCAIRMRSKETDRPAAIKKLEHDIKNCFNHIFGEHENCNKDVCKAQEECQEEGDGRDEHEESTGGKATKTAVHVRGGTTEERRKECRGAREGGTFNIDSEMRNDVMRILNRVAGKSEKLISNYTTNLAENWMSIRSKFDGGKFVNRCSRASWHARCHGAALRRNLGCGWSAKVWEEVTKTPATSVFHRRGEANARAITAQAKSQGSADVRKRKWKRKLARQVKNQSTKAKLAYGPDIGEECADVDPTELATLKDKFYREQVKIGATQCTDLEKSTREQSLCDEWHSNRKIRLTASNFGNILSKKPKTKLKATVERLLYGNFQGTSCTRYGLRQERASIQEYEILQSSTENITVEPCGLFANPAIPFLGASPDGIVFVNGVASGLLEIKNVLKDKPITLLEASRKSSFCLKSIDGKLELKKHHAYYYQCLGQLQITGYSWLDFIVRTVEPYELHVERIVPDVDLWDSVMLPKLSNFYFKAVLPELALPRHGKIPGIREPGPNWIDDKPSPKQPDVKPQGNVSNDQPHTRPTRRCRLPQIQFVGKRITHLWIDNQQQEWFPGTVLRLLSGTDGGQQAEHEVKYDGDHETYIVDHLLQDYVEKSLFFV